MCNFSFLFVLEDGIVKGNLIKFVDDLDQQIIIRILENFFSLFMLKKDLVKLGKCILIDFENSVLLIVSLISKLDQYLLLKKNCYLVDIKNYF